MTWFAQRDRLGQGFEPHPVLGETGDRQRPADGPQRDHELVVAQVLLEAVKRADLDAVVLGRRAGDAREAQVDRRIELLAQRHDDVTWLERAGRGHRQKRGVEQ